MLVREFTMDFVINFDYLDRNSEKLKEVLIKNAVPFDYARMNQCLNTQLDNKYFLTKRFDYLSRAIAAAMPKMIESTEARGILSDLRVKRHVVNCERFSESIFHLEVKFVLNSDQYNKYLASCGCKANFFNDNNFLVEVAVDNESLSCFNNFFHRNLKFIFRCMFDQVFFVDNEFGYIHRFDMLFFFRKFINFHSAMRTRLMVIR